MRYSPLKLLVIVSAAVLLGACAEDTAYRVASFLFDGVPPPEAEDEQTPDEVSNDGEAAAQLVPEPDENTEADLILEKRVIAHAPYEAGSCSSCHDTKRSNQLVLAGNDLCADCHDGVLSGKPVVHIAALIDCMICHDPHRSEEESLLRKTVVDLCLDCHVRVDVEEVHGQILDCRSCHNPHESDLPSLLEFK